MDSILLEVSTKKKRRRPVGYSTTRIYDESSGDEVSKKEYHYVYVRLMLSIAS